MMNRIKTTKAREEFGAVINKVAYGKEHFIVQRRGKDLAAIIPMEEFQLLEEYIEKLEDAYDIKQAELALAEKGPNIPMDEVFRELGMKHVRGRMAPGRRKGSEKATAPRRQANPGARERSGRRSAAG
jgi:prevent-host-death family protein